MLTAVRITRGRASNRHERGQVLPIVALLTTVLFGMTALAIDGSHGHEIQLQSQYTADSSAVSAAKVLAAESLTGPPAYTNASPDQGILTAERIPYLEGVHTDGAHACVTTSGTQTDVVYYDVTPAVGCAAAATPPANWHQKVEVTVPPTGVIPATCTPSYSCIRVTVMQILPTYLAGTIGFSSLRVVATGVSAIGTSSVMPCVLCLLGGTGVTGNVSGGSTLAVNNGAMAANSSNAAALTATGGSKITASGGASTVEVVGGESCTGGSTCTTPHTGITALPDPYGGLPYPSVAGASGGAFICTNGATCAINAGVWTSFSISGGATVNMGSGTYVFTGLFTVDNGAHINGSLITLYLTCSGYSAPGNLSPCASGQAPKTSCPGTGGFNIDGGSQLNITAPTTGTYQGMGIFLDRNNPAPICINNGTSPHIGSMYGADSNLIVTGGSGTSGIAVVNSVNVSGGSTITFDTSVAGAGAPANTGGLGVPTIVG